MSDVDPSPSRRDFAVALDFRDLLGAAGLGAIVAGAVMIHVGLALMAGGAALVAVAWRLSREP